MPEPEVGNAFLSLLSELRQGETLADLHQALVGLVGDVRSVGKAGALTLTIKVAMSKGSTTTIVVNDEIKVTEPKADKEITILYADDANRLSRRDPRQPRLPEMQAPAMPTSDVRQFSRPVAVNDKTGEVQE